MYSQFLKLARQQINRVGFDIIKHHPSSFDSNFPKDFDRDKIQTILKVQPYTMTSKARLSALCDAVQYVVQNQIPGDVVECGVWKGGSMMAVAHTLLRLDDKSRSLYLFDTFDGMTEPGENDISVTGQTAAQLLEQGNKEKDETVWCYAPIDQVRSAIHATGYPTDKIHLVKGRVEDTVPLNAPNEIAILRLDTDWYESTRHEMIHLFPRIAIGGVLIIDDYGWWEGARQAVDEYIEARKIQIFLNRIDYTGRLGIVTSHGSNPADPLPNYASSSTT
jgi:O-methyltransferase